MGLWEAVQVSRGRGQMIGSDATGQRWAAWRRQPSESLWLPRWDVGLAACRPDASPGLQQPLPCPSVLSGALGVALRGLECALPTLLLGEPSPADCIGPRMLVMLLWRSQGGVWGGRSGYALWLPLAQAWTSAVPGSRGALGTTRQEAPGHGALAEGGGGPLLPHLHLLPPPRLCQGASACTARAGFMPSPLPGARG